MTETDWLACTDPTPMLDFLRGKASERKLRLFAVACCRNVWHLLQDQQSRKAVEVAERFADGQVSKRELDVAMTAAYDVGVGEAGWDDESPIYSSPCDAAADAATYSCTCLSDTLPPPDLVFVADVAAVASGGGSRLWQCSLLRDIVGPFLFRPVSTDSSRLRECAGRAISTAQSIYSGRAFYRMPELADALEKAGCTDPGILDHCRGAGPHVRGCWVIDLLLGKE